MIKFSNGSIRGVFSPSYGVVGLPFKGGVETKSHKRGGVVRGRAGCADGSGTNTERLGENGGVAWIWALQSGIGGTGEPVARPKASSLQPTLSIGTLPDRSLTEIVVGWN